MDDMITEALIEMHYHRTLVTLFSRLFGKNFLKLLKPSPRSEVWVGFDQGWVYTNMSSMDLIEQLKKAIKNGNNSAPGLFLGYFLQFKLTSKILKRSKYTPKSFLLPHYRAELSLKRNKKTGLSQHETLLRLKNIKNSRVNYACAMLHSLEDIYEEPDLSKLRIIDLNEKSNFSRGRHFIYFQNEAALPIWKSESIEGTSKSLEEWTRNFELLTAKELLNLIEDTVKLLLPENQQRSNIFLSPDFTRILPESFTIIEFAN